MVDTYIKSGMLFKRKHLGKMLIDIAHNKPEYSKSVYQIDLLFDIIEKIDGNIWTAYLASHGATEATMEIKNFCEQNKGEIENEISEAWQGQETKLLANDLLSKLILK